MTPVTLILPYPVSANRYWATRVVKPKGKPAMALTYVTKEANDYKAQVQAIARAAGLEAPIQGRVKLELWLFPHRPKDWEARVRKFGMEWDDGVRCIDLGNCEKILSDALNGICFVDDSQHRQIIKTRMEPDARGARVIARISPLTSFEPDLLT